ncbi:MAG: endolytic transglycosylase MltG [Melioribacteraceae bacterium]|nr:endolytic transglycosylase MltG [Melioribacteraceae bacterium]MCF8354392.1 endolytic transglycosylase MltG [Melioribacteraceae bacterium]MCF8393011.1 endolytic transglycosylase MltG [Melioribacteraceae bacterium]MCF8417246.1 endolytic transglycosylase MltG [Melioribacteraceae bacterium]
MNTSKENPITFTSVLFSKNELYLIGTFFGFMLGIFLFTFFTPNYFDSDEAKTIEISRGKSLNEIIDTLYVEKVIPSKTNMKIAAFLYGAERKIKAGSYRIPNGLSYLDLIELLLKGTVDEQILVTIPEGIWQFKLASLLKKELKIDSTKFMELSKNKSFLQSLGIDKPTIEGYLLPETYYFYKNTSAEEVLRKLKKEMDALFTDKELARMKKLGRSKHDILIIASIVEGESNIHEEFAKIAGVYYNRLEKGIALQADPTIQYLIRERKRYNRILFKDLEIKSKYNTYMFPGLPPTPINNPGKDAIMAALYPEEHDFYYFVADGNGGHVFAKTYSEHVRNVNEYRRWRDSQR